jgi:hypothetical protein
VAQLAGYVSEHSAYHHGEASLQATIVNLAQVGGPLIAAMPSRLHACELSLLSG